VSPKEFADLIPALEAKLRATIAESMPIIGEMVAQEAREMIGHAQPEWPALAEATLQRKKLPAPGDPLLRTGELRDSIQFTSSATRVTIGSNDPKAVIHEHGDPTHRIPPRPIFRSAAHRKAQEVRAVLGARIANVLKG
jgi:phage gpG-like protein